MTKIKLTCRKTPSSHNLSNHLSSSSASLNNNNSYINSGNSNLIYRPLSAKTTTTSNDEYIDSQVKKMLNNNTPIATIMIFKYKKGFEIDFKSFRSHLQEYQPGRYVWQLSSASLDRLF